MLLLQVVQCGVESHGYGVLCGSVLAVLVCFESRNSFIYISFFSFLSFLPTVCQTCPKDWIQFQKSCYFFNHFISQWKTWDQSRQFCQSNKSDLTFIKNTIQYYYDIWHGYWIGLQKVNNKWIWVDGNLQQTFRFSCFLTFEAENVWINLKGNFTHHRV
uniref:C-type lectin domain-containing protein n=1 Tax=Oryzias latipes TaxID=8090 RepID=A0A3P9KX14_ORYLA